METAELAIQSSGKFKKQNQSFENDVFFYADFRLGYVKYRAKKGSYYVRVLKGLKFDVFN